MNERETIGVEETSDSESVKNKQSVYSSNLQGFTQYINKNKIKRRASKERDDKKRKNKGKMSNQYQIYD